MKIYNDISGKILLLMNSFNKIPQERKELLEQFADYIATKITNNKKVNLIFICTHNSRRSIMSQIWAKTVAEYFDLPKVNCYSGGTEATAFNPRAVKAIRNFGFKVKQLSNSANPHYAVYYSDEKEPIECFSKVYSHKSNPQKDFIAIMTCSNADANCPVVLGAEARFPIRYDDPKEFDNTEYEEEKYNERFEQIGREIIYAFNNIKHQQ